MGRGRQRPGWMGNVHHQLRFLDRDWTRRNSDFCDSVCIPPAVENRDQPLRRSNDDLLCDDGRFFHSAARRTYLGHLLGLPIPNERGVLWPNFRSPLAWDEFAISTYFITSLVFWYIGLVLTSRPFATESTQAQQVRKCARWSTLSFHLDGLDLQSSVEPLRKQLR